MTTKQTTNMTGGGRANATNAPTATGSRWSRRRLARSAASLGALTLGVTTGGIRLGAYANAQGTPLASPVASPVAGGLEIRGISYEVGIDWAPGESSRPIWNIDFVRHDLEAIRDQLHCTAVSIFGTDSDRAIEAAAVAQELGLDVWIQPRLVDGTQEATLEQLAAFARGAEELRQTNPNIVLNAGCELSIFMNGIIPGATYVERLGTLAETFAALADYTMALNEFLQQATDVARAEFGGTLTYGGGFWEAVDWTRFDIVGLNHYKQPGFAENYASELQRQVTEAGDKPVVITEFGCASFEGAAEMGGGGFTIVDWTTTPPSLNGDYVRSEEEQASELMSMLDVFEAEGVTGAFVFTFIDTAYTYSPDPKYDLDMASFAIVKTFPPDSGQSYEETGYWEPKLAFDALAERYGTT